MKAVVFCAPLFGLCAVPVELLAGGADWVSFAQETSSRLSVSAELGVNDLQEKDFAWGDLDQDGDDDLLVVRKQPFTTSGGRRNVLLMNEDGVLVDRTAEFAAAADDGGQGFLDITNDRDVVLADLDGDGWLDFVTAPACNLSTAQCEALPKTISHPRVYMNLGLQDDQWQGFEYQEARFPQLVQFPNFCGVAAGDVTGNDAPDLYFTDYNSGLEDRLLINDGNGSFTDQSTLRMTSNMLSSSFGTHAVILDMNNDGWNDVVKGENGPVETLYNDGEGFFTIQQSTYSGSSYFFNVGDLNNDDKLDIVISDDGLDRYLLNLGNAGGDNTAQFSNNAFTFSGGTGDDGFGSNSLVVDLNNDGWNDVVICDVDVDAPGCGRHTNIFHNLGGTPGNPVTLQAQGTAGIGSPGLLGVHDVAVLDINGDSWPDMVLGRCSGTEVWINQPPFGVEFSLPQALPTIYDPAEPPVLQLELIPAGGATPAAGGVQLHYSVNGGPFQALVMSDAGGNIFEVPLPQTNCLDTVDYYFSVTIDQGGTFFNPPDAPQDTYTTIAAVAQVVAFEDGMEDEFNWTVVNDAGLLVGGWEAAEPLGTIFNGDLAAPGEDAESEPGRTRAAVTQNCPPPPTACGGHPAASADVDGGPTDLISPPLLLAGSNATIRYHLWYYTSGDDPLEVAVSNDDGESYVTVELATTTSDEGDGTTTWQERSFRVGDYVVPTHQVRVRFRADDQDPGEVVEAGIDRFSVEKFLCQACGEIACCDSDGNGIRDDGCAWCDCSGPCGESVGEIPIVFGDMGGQFGECLPDGAADSNDRFHALNCFADVDLTGNPQSYPCESDPPSAINVDTGGPFGDFAPDGVCDANDAFHALNAFGSMTTCSCPLDGGPAPDFEQQPRVLAKTAISGRAGHAAIVPGDLVEVDFHLDGPLQDLRGYQLHVGVEGGRRGHLELIDILVDPGKRPVLQGHNPWTAFNVRTSQMLAGLDRDGVAAPQGGYLATFVFRASAEATGRFAIDARVDETAGHRTFMFPTPANGKIAVYQSAAAVVDVLRGRDAR